jgi:hypothetical protein
MMYRNINWLGINISYKNVNLKKEMNGFCFKDLLKFYATSAVNKDRKIDTSKEISEAEFKEVIRIINETIEEKIFDGVFEEMEEEIMNKLMNMREENDE